MIRNIVQTPPRWWSPKISPFWVRFWRPFRIRRQHKLLALRDVQVRGLEHLSSAVDNGHSVLITPNHPGPTDPYAMYHVADALGKPFYFMAAWQTFGRANWLVSQILRRHGCFSVDREGTDLNAFKHAVKILEQGKFPLVVFPEGEVYHINDRLTPFREGAAAIALTAARRAKQPVVVVPAAIKYFYLEDPTEALHAVMERLEGVIFWRPRTGLTLQQRIYRYAEAILAVKELEYMGCTSAGPLPRRIADLREEILGGLENCYDIAGDNLSIPERIKTIRQRAVKKIESLPADDPGRTKCEQDLDDVFLVVQLFSYPGDYVAESPASIERIAETIDKFEEDVLGERTVASRGARMAVVQLGEPIRVEVPNGKDRREAGPRFTRQLEACVQGLLDQIEPPPNRDFAAAPEQEPAVT